MKNRFINVGSNTFISVNNIEIITDLYHIKDFKIKKSEFKLRNKYIDISGNNKIQSYTLTFDKTLIKSSVKAKTIIKEEFEKYFLSIGKQSNSYINISKIEFITEFTRHKASLDKLIKERRYENKLFDLTRNKKSRSIIVMKNSNNVYISPVNPDTLIGRIP